MIPALSRSVKFIQDYTCTEVDVGNVVGMENTITISKDEYLRLLKADAKLTAAEAAGVDNWDGWWDTEMKHTYNEIISEIEKQSI